MFDQSRSHLLAAQEHVTELRRQAANRTVAHAARAERRRAARQAALAQLDAQSVELDRLAASSWQEQHQHASPEPTAKLLGTRS